MVVEKLPIELTISIGISVGPGHGDSAELLLRRADTALEAARAQRQRLRGLRAGARPLRPAARSCCWASCGGRSRADELLLHYQPKVDLKSRTITGTEALVRWRHPKRGLLPPDRFIPLAEQGGLIKPLTRWVLGDAVDAVPRLAAAGPRPPGLGEPLRAQPAGRPARWTTSRTSWTTHSLPPDLLRLELTESTVMADPAHAVRVAGQPARDAGVAVAIDDFGTGYSSLAYLRRLPVSELKIDKSFVIGMAGASRRTRPSCAPPSTSGTTWA